jgi:hypothetical protein
MPMELSPFWTYRDAYDTPQPQTEAFSKASGLTGLVK